ncbi:hypothetical protein F4810DRAFT_675314 [Camillea tinctor]|nr:hypothetical protein F4810DRAFT_675314 [Camillea tinctor]
MISRSWSPGFPVLLFFLALLSSLLPSGARIRSRCKSLHSHTMLCACSNTLSSPSIAPLTTTSNSGVTADSDVSTLNNLNGRLQHILLRYINAQQQPPLTIQERKLLSWPADPELLSHNTRPHLRAGSEGLNITPAFFSQVAHARLMPCTTIRIRIFLISFFYIIGRFHIGEKGTIKQQLQHNTGANGRVY